MVELEVGVFLTVSFIILEKTLHIRKNKRHSIERQHPWIFSGAIYSDVSEISDGDVVTVLDHQDKFLARGHFQHATISVRILTFDDLELNQTFFNHRIANAVSMRLSQNLIRNDSNICRLVHGEGDSLPGLIVDYYAGVAVIQCHSIGMLNSLNLISNGLQAALGEKLVAVYTKSSDTLPERAENEDKYLFGSCPTPHLALENGVKLNIDWIHGQKTGFFVDQRESRLLMAKYSKGKRVLNTFCYSGGFSLLALHHGASHVDSVDSSKKAIILTDENIQLNNFGDRHTSIVADAMNYLKELEHNYDVVILDPPAFAKHREKRHRAVQGYKRLNSNAIRQIKPGGIIFTFSCSQVVDKQLFTNTVIAAAIEAGRNVRILEQLHQPSDHPISTFHPEGEYLKGLVIQVD